MAESSRAAKKTKTSDDVHRFLDLVAEAADGSDGESSEEYEEDFIDDAEEEFGQESSLLHAEIDVLARVVPVPNETNMSRSEDEAARDIVDRWKRSRFISESTTTESEQLTQTQLRLIDIAKASVGPIDYDMRALRRNRRLEIIDEVNRARRQARRALERAGEEIPPELGTDKDAKCPSGNHEELFSEETYERSPPDFKNKEWVRSTRGLYRGDLALVFYPTVNGKLWPSRMRPRPEYITCVVVPRWDMRTQSEDSNLKRKRRRRPRASIVVDANPDAPHRFVGCSTFTHPNTKKKAAFYHNLLLVSLPAKFLERSRPYSVGELQPFVEARLDLRSWKRRLSQETLRADDKVRIVGGELNDHIAVIKEIIPAEFAATVVVFGRDDSESEPSIVKVDVRLLERHFEIGDNVRCVSTREGEEDKFGTVVKVADWGMVEYERLLWIPDRVDPIRVTPPDCLNLEKVRSVDIEVLQMPQNTTFVVGQFDLELYEMHVWGPHINVRDKYLRLDIQRCTEHYHMELDNRGCEQCLAAARNVPLGAISSDAGAAILNGQHEERRLGSPLTSSNSSRQAMHTGTDSCIYNNVLIIKGEYKMCTGEYMSSNGKKANVRIHARGGIVAEVEMEHVYNMNTGRLQCSNPQTLQEIAHLSRLASIAAQYQPNPSDLEQEQIRAATPEPETIDHLLASSSTSMHWLLDPVIREVLRRYRLYVTCDRSNFFPSDFQRTTLKTLRFDEWDAHELHATDQQVLCTYERRRGATVVVALDICSLKPQLPNGKTQGIIIKDPGQVKATNPSKRAWWVEFSGADIVGHTLVFNKKEPRVREDPGVRSKQREKRKQRTAEGLQTHTGDDDCIASLRVIEAFGDVPVGSYVRVPVDCVCKFEK